MKKGGVFFFVPLRRLPPKNNSQKRRAKKNIKTQTTQQTLQIRNRAANGETFATGSMKIPMVDLPLGATEDRVCGTIDIEKALSEGVKAFEPGLLAKANRCVLISC
jgi:Mg-chelatase subunit ChlI